jgi:two-component system phosphate regulon sensor histidine kinase PhoR
MDHLAATSDVAMQNHDISQLTFHRFVIDNLPCAVMTVDSNFKISSVNPWAEKLTGYSSAEAIGRYCGDILQCDMCKHVCPLRGAVRGGEPVVNVETTIRNKGGEAIAVTMNTAALLNDRGELVGGVEAFQDISHIKALEREKANFISMIAHDIKSPIVAIGGFAHRILKKELGADKEKQKQYVEIISREANRAELLVNDFLEFSRLDVGALNLSFGPTDLNKELIQLLETYETKALKRGIKIELTSPNALPMIEADANRLRRVFNNLMDNALKFSKDKGTIIIATEETEKEVTIRVIDQGVGIEMKNIPYLFDPFYQGPDREEKEGFGLGLAIVKAIVKGHGGRVLVESEPGKGSVFSVLLPKVRKQSELE